MGVSSRNHACRMSGLTMPASWIMRTCLRIVFCFPNWKTSLSCCRSSRRKTTKCSGSRKWEHLRIGLSITTTWMLNPCFYMGLAIYLFKGAVPLPGLSIKFGGAEPGLLSKAWSGQNKNLFTQIQSCKDVSKSSRLRRQRAVPKHSVGRHALQQGGGTKARERRKVSQISAAGQMVWLSQGGNWGAQRVVTEVRRNAAFVLQQTRPKRGSATAHERILGLQQPQAHAWPTKAGWHTFSPKNSIVPTTVEMASWSCFENHSDASNHWLCSTKDLHVVCEQSQGEPA